MKLLSQRRHVGAEAIELSEPENGDAADTKRMEELGRMPKIPLTRRLVHRQAVWGLASTVVITWQNMLFLSAIALSSGGLAGFLWSSVIVFVAIWPVAAGQYYWVAQLAPCRYAKPLSFLSGWKLMSSWQVFLAAGVMIVGNGVAAVVVFLHGSSPFWLPTVLGIVTTILIFVVNRWCPHILAKAEFPMLIFHLIVFALFMAILLGLRKFSGLPYATPGDVFFTFRNGGGWASIGAAVSLTATVPLSSAIGYDCIFHLGEEIRGAATIMPTVLTWACAVNFTLGLATVLVIGFSVDDVDALLSTPLSQSGPVGPVIQMFATAIVSRPWTTAVSIMFIATLIPCCINSDTAASRQLWAFAEDGALPNSGWIQKVDEKNGVPSNALMLTLIAPIGLSLLNLGSPTALNAIISLVIVNLMASYLLVASTSLYSRCTGARKSPQELIYGLGYRTGIAVDSFTIAFLTASSIIVLSVS
ncbi:hypothetical protein LTR33_011330 [Friedmanniomyces endolithicus]|nr:hypothetical protein LTR59_016255 [Friedmanniomyces endolithicus]KAK0956408.1 hypothetical protein LTS01_022872 [Friedmanniomyces endolithicus]KAK1067557.1 hypothetical protein LTR33_011330 [Friedmanniomyces endolithicus]